MTWWYSSAKIFKRNISIRWRRKIITVIVVPRVKASNRPYLCRSLSHMYLCVFSFKHFGTANRNHLSFIFRNQFCKALLGKCILTGRSQSHVQVLYRHWCPFLWCVRLQCTLLTLTKSNLTFHENKKWIMRRGYINELWFLCVNNGCTFRYVFTSIFCKLSPENESGAIKICNMTFLLYTNYSFPRTLLLYHN